LSSPEKKALHNAFFCVLEAGSTSRRLVNMWDTLLQSRKPVNTKLQKKICPAEAAISDLCKALEKRIFLFLNKKN